MVALTAVVLGAGIYAAVKIIGGSGAAQPGPAAAAYLAAWSRRDYAAMALLVDRPPANFAGFHQQLADELKLVSQQYQPGPVTSHGATAEAGYTARLVIGGLGTWQFPGTVQLRLVGGHWLVAWAPSTIHPGLPAGGHFGVSHIWADRAPILGAGGAVLAGPSNLVNVGLQGSRIKDRSQLTAALTKVGFDPAAVANAIKTADAHPDQFVPVADVPDARYTQIKPDIFSVPGTVFQRHTGQATITADLAAHVVGSLGPVTADELKQLGDPYLATDQVGQAGLEALDERQLAGTPGGAVKVMDGTGGTVATVFNVPPKAGTPVQTSIDPHVEQAAEAALSGTAQPAALVAIRASTGEVLAAVSRPVSAPFDRALTGRYPPGSTFKIITTATLLARGLTPASPATCPPTLTVDGRTFKNFEGEAGLNLTLQQAFAISCNTAFIGLASGLPPESLVATAGQFGFGSDPKPGLTAFGGRVPLPADQVGKVATAIGQAQVEASPLQMAGVAAAVDSGAVHAPRLVAGAPDDTVPAVPLDAGVAAALRTMMGQVVTSGTGKAANVAGSPAVFGKTGTAEFGNANPPMTHAWFVGFRGDTAFAVLVEGGGVGGAVAAPVAARFLNGL